MTKSALEMKTSIRYVPYTPGGTPLDWLASDTEAEAWKKLLKDAAHMPYKTVENFKKRGYVVERETWTERT